MKSLLLIALLSIGQSELKDAPEAAKEQASAVETAPQQTAQVAPEPFEAFSEAVLEEMGARYTSSERLPNELKYRINRYFKSGSVIIIGKIKKPEDAEISALVTIEDDGSFASAVAPGRKLVFYAHGYHPIVAEPTNPVEGPLYDVGELVFEPLEADRQSSLTCIAVTRDTKFDQLIEARLIINHRDFLGRDGGTWQAWYRPTVETVSLRHGERFTFTGLGPNPYRLELWSEGYVIEAVDLQPELGDTIDLDALVVTPAKKLSFRYIGNFDLNNQGAWPDFKTSELLANGKTQFVFHKERHPKGYMKQSRIRLVPEGGQVEAYYPVIPSEYYDFGQVAIEDIRAEDFSPEALELKRVERPVHLQSGHVYFMQNIRREVNALFEVTLLSE